MSTNIPERPRRGFDDPIDNPLAENIPDIGGAAEVAAADAGVGPTAAVVPNEVAGDQKRISRTRLTLRRFWRPMGAKVGTLGLLLIVLLAIIGPHLTHWRYDEVDNFSFLKSPGGDHWWGTTQGGRDVFAECMEGLRKSLVIGFVASFLIEVIAAFVGATAAYFGKRIDKAILWVVDLMLVIPSFLMIAIVSQKTGGHKGSLWLFILLVVAFGWMLSGRVVRAMTLSTVNLDYVNAARFMSVPSRVIITKHVLPNISSFLIIDFALGIVGAIMSETALSYFGFGVQAPDVSLGTILGEGTQMATTFPWVFLFPAGLLVITLLCVNFMADALRDAIDPSSKSGGRA